VIFDNFSVVDRNCCQKPKHLQPFWSNDRRNLAFFLTKNEHKVEHKYLHALAKSATAEGIELSDLNLSVILILQ